MTANPATRKLVILLVFLSASSLSSERFDEVLGSTVRIKCERINGDGDKVTDRGTAFGVDLSQYGLVGKRYLLTAVHNVLDEQKRPIRNMQAELSNDSWSNCSVLFLDEDLDLCILKTKDELNSTLKLDDSDSSPGDEIVMAGSKEGAPVKLFRGTLKKRFAMGRIHSYAKIEFGLGDSGSPMVSAKTLKVVGIAVAGLPNNDGTIDGKHGLYVPVIAIRSFLEDIK